MAKRPEYKHRKYRPKNWYVSENAVDRSDFGHQSTVQGRVANAAHDYKDQKSSREGKASQIGKWTASGSKMKEGKAYKRDDG